MCILPYAHIGKVTAYIFLILSIHELAHILCAFLFHYPIEKVIIYPFGLAAQISYIGYGRIEKEVCIIAAGPLTHVFIPFLLLGMLRFQVISQSFYEYLLMMNASILVFNVLPIYPLDGGRLLQSLFHCFLRYKSAQRATFLASVFFIFFVIYMGVMQGVSAYFVFVFLFVQNALSLKGIALSQLRFFHYRMYHPVNYPIKMNDKTDLFRSRSNMMHMRKGWISEQEWLAYKFSNPQSDQSKKSREK